MSLGYCEESKLRVFNASGDGVLLNCIHLEILDCFAFQVNFSSLTVLRPFFSV